jgi:hypothetical protein
MAACGVFACAVGDFLCALRARPRRSAAKTARPGPDGGRARNWQRGSARRPSRTSAARLDARRLSVAGRTSATGRERDCARGDHRTQDRHRRTVCDSSVSRPLVVQRATNGRVQFQQAAPAARCVDTLTHRVAARAHPFEVPVLEIDARLSGADLGERDLDLTRTGEVGFEAPTSWRGLCSREGTRRAGGSHVIDSVAPGNNQCRCLSCSV